MRRLFEDDELVDLVDGMGLRLTIGPDHLERYRIVPLTKPETSSLAER